MSVILTPHAETRIRHLIESGQFPNAAAVIDRALEALDDEQRARFEQARALALAGLQSGDAVELTDGLWDEMEREADAAYRRGE